MLSVPPLLVSEGLSRSDVEEPLRALEEGAGDPISSDKRSKSGVGDDDGRGGDDEGGEEGEGENLEGVEGEDANSGAEYC